MSFAAGLFTGIVITVLAGFFVFRARAIGGQTSGRRVDMRALVALAALVIAVFAFVRGGHSDSHSTGATTTTTTTDAPATDPTTTSRPTTTTTAKAVLVKVPNVVGLAQINATAQLRAKGFQVRVQPLPLSNVTPGFVLSQTPGAFSTVIANSVVILSVTTRA